MDDVEAKRRDMEMDNADNHIKLGLYEIQTRGPGRHNTQNANAELDGYGR
jgi:hypothetical protein